MSVPTTPGQYAFTVMPSDANSFADALAGTGDERDFPVDAHGGLHSNPPTREMG
jgi:hypothetical protein